MGEEVVAKDAVDRPLAFAHVRRLDREALEHAALAQVGRIAGKDFGERLNEAAVLVAAPAALLELEEIETAVQQPAVVRELGIEVVADTATVSERLDGYLGEVADELRVGDLIDAAAILFQGNYLVFEPGSGEARLTIIPCERGVWVDRRATTRPHFEVEVGRRAERVAGIADISHTLTA